MADADFQTAKPTRRHQGAREIPGPERRAAARAMYEGEPGSTVALIAKECGVDEYTVREWARKEGWRPAPVRIKDLGARAGALADTFKTKMSELGKPLDDTVAAAEASRELANGHAVNVRAGVLDRHRKEWAAPRKLAYEAVSKRDFELAKLAKITSETLTLIQQGECRAYGINHEARAADADRTIIYLDRAEKKPEADQALALVMHGMPDSVTQTSPEGDTSTTPDSPDLNLNDEF